MSTLLRHERAQVVEFVSIDNSARRVHCTQTRCVQTQQREEPQPEFHRPSAGKLTQEESVVGIVQVAVRRPIISSSPLKRSRGNVLPHPAPVIIE